MNELLKRYIDWREQDDFNLQHDHQRDTGSIREIAEELADMLIDLSPRSLDDVTTDLGCEDYHRSRDD